MISDWQYKGKQLRTNKTLFSQSEPVNAVNELEDEDADEKQPQQSGEYYVALPDGRLQRVRYISRQNVEAMKYFAKIRAENVEPLRGPIYAYAPLQKLQIVPAGLQVSVAPVAPIAAAVAPAEARPQKLEIEPVAAQVQYQYDNPSSVVPLANPLSNSYTTYTNYQAPAANTESRFLLTFQWTGLKPITPRQLYMLHRLLNVFAIRLNWRRNKADANEACVFMSL